MRGLVVIGGSAGSMPPCRRILRQLPANFALPVAVVIHAHPSQDDSRLALLRQECLLTILDVVGSMPLTPGTIFFAPPNYHLLVEADHTLSLSVDEKVNFSRPSIDVLFESAADAFGASVIAIVLSGANHDGALGLKAIAEAGGLTIVEDPELAVVKDMPLAALTQVPTSTVLAGGDIAPFVISQVAAMASGREGGAP